MKDGFRDFDWSLFLHTLDMMVVGNMSDMDHGGILGMDIECYTYYGVNLMVGGNTIGGSRLRVSN